MCESPEVPGSRKKAGVTGAYRAISRHPCPGQFRLLRQSTIRWVADKQQKFISQLWRLQSPKSRWWQIRYLERPCFWVHTQPSSCCVLMGRKQCSGVSFTRTLISFLRALPSCLLISQRPHLQIPSCWGFDFNNLGRGNI